MATADTAYLAQWKPLARMRAHEQVMAEIENRLMAGRLKVGDRLPPERQFAEILGVGRGAVREALRILEAVGIVEASTGSGPSAGSVIVKDGVAGMAMVLRLHLQAASFRREDMVEARSLIERLAAHNDLAAVLMAALQQAQQYPDSIAALAGRDRDLVAEPLADSLCGTSHAPGSRGLKQAG